MTGQQIKHYFVRHLIELRQERGMSQADLAKALGISRSAVGMYEQGRREPDFETIGSISDYFGVSFDWLLGYEEEAF